MSNKAYTQCGLCHNYDHPRRERLLMVGDDCGSTMSPQACQRSNAFTHGMPSQPLRSFRLRASARWQQLTCGTSKLWSTMTTRMIASSSAASARSLCAIVAQHQTAGLRTVCSLRITTLWTGESAWHVSHTAPTMEPSQWTNRLSTDAAPYKWLRHAYKVTAKSHTHRAEVAPRMKCTTNQ